MIDLFGSQERSPPFALPNFCRYDARWCEDRKGFEIQIPGGELFYAAQFFSKKVSDRTVAYFQENSTVDWRHSTWRDVSPEQVGHVSFTNINWKQDWINLYGRHHPLPRLTAWYGDSGRTYSYSGITSQPNQWNAGLLYIKDEIEKCAGAEFNSVLLNWYRDGNDHLAWHSDDEVELGPDPIIASANFGATRDFLLRRKDDHSEKLTIPLKHGTLLLMAGETQHFWEHSVPKRTKVATSRFNLTFRHIGPS